MNTALESLVSWAGQAQQLTAELDSAGVPHASEIDGHTLTLVERVRLVSAAAWLMDADEDDDEF